MSKKFDEFVTMQQTAESAEKIDWNQQRVDWLRHLDDFYSVVDSALKPYLDQGKLEITYEVRKITEEYIGVYDAKFALVKVGKVTARINPIGTMLIGAKGRVDLIGPSGTARFVLVDADSTGPKITVRSWSEGQTPPPEVQAKKVVNWAWKRTTMPPRISYLPFTEDSFRDSLVEVMNG